MNSFSCWVFFSRKEDVQARLAKLANKAPKLGLANLKYSFDSTRWIHVNNMNLLQIQLTVSGPTEVRLDGWEFIACLDHTEKGVIIRKLSEETIPEKYHNSKGNCDHCNQSRYRTKTLVLKHRSGVFCEVGTSCLQDFLGNNVRDSVQIFEYLQDLRSLEDYGSYSEDMGYAKSNTYPLATYLSLACEIVSRKGFISKKESEEKDVPATCMIAWDSISQKKVVDPKHLDKAKMIIEWAKNLSDDKCMKSDYMHNLRVIANNDYVCPKTYGFAASMLVAYERANEVRENTSTFQGKVGEKLYLRVRVNKVIDFATGHGYCHFHIMNDECGNVYVWKASEKRLEPGTYLLEGKVKQHTEYKGVLQTHITRCKIV